MKWAAWEGRDGNLHVLPCDDDGEMRDGHLMQAYCPCGPSVEKAIGTTRLLVGHEEPEVTQRATQH